MPSRLIQLKDIDSSPNDLLFPITIGEAVSVTFDGTSHTLQSVVDLIPTADGGSSGSTQTVAGKTVILGTTGKAVVTVNGLDSGTVALPDLCPWPISLGNIDNSGAITGGTVAPASGQNLAVTDTTGLVIRSSIAFDTTDTSKYLRHDGTWASLPAAATNAVGIVQLTDSTSSTSTTTAATPNSVKSAYDLAAAAIPKSIGTAQGDIIYFTGSGAPARLAKGTAGQVLTMNAGATAPSWATPSSGGGSLVVSFTLDLDSSPMTASTTTSIDTIINAINDGKYVVGESPMFGLMRFQLVSWYENPGNYRRVMFVLQVNLNAYIITGESNYSGSAWTDEWTVDENSANLTSLPDVEADSPGNGQVLGYNANSGNWEPMTVAAGGTQINWTEYTYN